MKTKFAIVLAAVFVGVAVSAQLRITSVNSSRELTWTNTIYRGLYGVESSSTLAGPWNLIGTVADTDGAKTNRIFFQSQLTNAPAFYRVRWIPPDPNGLWDYSGYEGGELVITGRLNLEMGSLLTTNPVGYRVGGSWNLGYVGPPTNAWQKYFWPLVGTGVLTGTVEFDTAFLRLYWPTNCIDCNIQLLRDIWGNTYTGTWTHYTIAGMRGGPFSAARVSSTNLTNSP